MGVANRIYTPAEAAAVSNVALKAVHNAIDKNIVGATANQMPASGRASRRTLTAEDLVRLKLWYGVGGVLPADRRQRLFDAITAHPSARTVRADDFLIVDVAEARKQISARMRELDEAEAAIHSIKSVMGGEPVFKGTRIPVRTVASMLADGADEDEILAGYPKLNARLLVLARIWFAAHPRRGRPKSLSEQGFKLKSSQPVVLKGDPQPSLGKAGAA